MPRDAQAKEDAVLRDTSLLDTSGKDNTLSKEDASFENTTPKITYFKDAMPKVVSPKDAILKEKLSLQGKIKLLAVKIYFLGVKKVLGHQNKSPGDKKEIFRG